MSDIPGASYNVIPYPNRDLPDFEANMAAYADVREWHLRLTLPGGQSESIRTGEGSDNESALGNLVARMIKHGDPVDAIKQAFHLWRVQYKAVHGNWPPGMHDEHDRV